MAGDRPGCYWLTRFRGAASAGSRPLGSAATGPRHRAKVPPALTVRGRPPRPDNSRSARAAVFLSFVWPGLGQLYLGRPKAALVYAVPIAVVLGLGGLLARDGLDIMVVRLFVPSTATVAILTVVFAAVWRLASMTDALRSVRTDMLLRSRQVGPRRPTPPRSSPIRFFAVLVVVVLASHGLLTWAGLAFRQAGAEIFLETRSPPIVGTRPLGSAQPVLPEATPQVTPEPDGWINLLLIGADSGLGYEHNLTDTMIVVSTNTVTRQSALFSLPRDIGRFPMYGGGTFSGKLNSLMSYAADRPAEYPDGGLGTLTREVGFLLGAPIHYYAYVNLAGFKTMIDVVGGVDVDNPRAINDPGYQFPDRSVGFKLSAGLHHLDGRTALAYVRSRNGPGDNDFTRARRQQQLLLALRAKMTDAAMLPNLPAVLDAAAKTVQTNYPAEQAPDLFAVAKSIGGDEIQQFVLGPPYAQRAPSSSTYVLLLDMTRIRDLSIRIFGAASSYHDASGGLP